MTTRTTTKRGTRRIIGMHVPLSREARAAFARVNRASLAFHAAIERYRQVVTARKEREKLEAILKRHGLL